jgi:hypothetical protein
MSGAQGAWALRGGQVGRRPGAQLLLPFQPRNQLLVKELGQELGQVQELAKELA